MTMGEEQPAKTKGTSPILYWIAVLTFVWALLGPLWLRHVVGWSKFLSFGFYPMLCLGAAIFLLAGRRRNHAFAIVNLLCGIGWVIYAYLVLQAFKAGFAR